MLNMQDGEFAVASAGQKMTPCVVAPSVPEITGWETGENFVNVSWSPTSDDSDDNPGHKFAVEYRKRGK